MKQIFKWSSVVVLFLFITGMIILGDHSHKTQAVALNPEQAEEQDLIQKIASGSVLWQKAKKQEDAAHYERVRQEQGNAGYRHTLCTKFGKMINESGSVVAIDNPMLGAPDIEKCQFFPLGQSPAR